MYTTNMREQNSVHIFLIKIKIQVCAGATCFALRLSSCFDILIEWNCWINFCKQNVLISL